MSLSRSMQKMNTILYCKNWQACVSFYETVLQLKVSIRNDWFVEFQINEGCCLSIANASKSSIEAGEGRAITLSFLMDDIHELHKKYLDLSIPITPIKTIWHKPSFFIFDPDNNRIEFWQDALQTHD